MVTWGPRAAWELPHKAALPLMPRQQSEHRLVSGQADRSLTHPRLWEDPQGQLPRAEAGRERGQTQAPFLQGPTEMERQAWVHATAALCLSFLIYQTEKQDGRAATKP